jgi:hypothetical protein
MELYSQEWRLKVSQKTKEAMRSLEVRSKHSKGCSARVVSEEGRLKQSAAQLRRYAGLPKLGKPLIVNDPEKDKRARVKIAESVSAYMASLSKKERAEKYFGMRGMHHTDETKERLSKSSAELYRSGVTSPKNKFFMYLGVPFANNWEVQFAQWLDSKGIVWEYQPIVFKVSKGKRYIPDFRLSESDKIFVEVKGYLKPLDIEKMNEFVKAGNILYYVDKQFFGVRGKNMLNNFQFNEKNLWTSRRS